MLSLIRRKALQQPWSNPPPLTALFSTLLPQQHYSEPPCIVDFLTNSCGLSTESAQSVSKKLEIQTLDQPNSVLAFLTSHGVSPKCIRTAVTLRPSILACDVDTTFNPKIQVLMSLGIVGDDLSFIIRKAPCLLMADVNAVVDFFKSNGFSKDQIVLLTKKRPSLYLLNAARNFGPKLEYLKGLGLSSSDVGAMVSSQPWALERSLEDHIKPSVELLTRVFGSDAKMLVALTGFSRVLDVKLGQLLETNVSIFLSHGMPESSLMRLFGFQQNPLFMNSDRLKEVADQVLEMGFNPKHFLFALAVRTIGTMSKSLWDQKMELYKCFGLSEDNVLQAFRKQPLFMIVSERKILKCMDFFINKLKMDPLCVAKTPNLLLASLEKKIVPRCSVLQILLRKGHVDKKMNLRYIFCQNEKKFMERYVNKYKDELPIVVDAHQGKVEFQGFSPRKSKLRKTLKAQL